MARKRRWLVRWASHCRHFGEKPRRFGNWKGPIPDDDDESQDVLGTVAHRGTLSRVSFIGAEATGAACSKTIRSQIIIPQRVHRKNPSHVTDHDSCSYARGFPCFVYEHLADLLSPRP
jgi:hypothetical protein